eukprot:TRINITY_DN2303_c0_g1_i6.p1 TRINITY_DN2303_c0_g1~~TRINITY_DN2303_c0_g1_i6.p1  ORF type:complete len:479 (-),score=92.46 TRINITY_DN2303_c0_g1_i6:56-1492(-)
MMGDPASSPIGNAPASWTAPASRISSLEPLHHSTTLPPMGPPNPQVPQKSNPKKPRKPKQSNTNPTSAQTIPSIPHSSASKAPAASKALAPSKAPTPSKAPAPSKAPVEKKHSSTSKNGTVGQSSSSVYSRVDIVEKQSKLNEVLAHSDVERYWDCLSRFLNAKLSRIEMEKVVCELLGDKVHLHNDLIMGIIHNATMVSDGGLSQTAAKSVKTKNASIKPAKVKKSAQKGPTATIVGADGSPNSSTASTPLFGSSSPALFATKAEKAPFSITGNSVESKPASKGSKSTAKHEKISGNKRKDPSSARLPSSKLSKKPKIFPPQFRHLPIPTSKLHVPMQHSSSSKSLDCTSSAADLPSDPYVNSILKNVCSRFGLSNVDTKAGSLMSKSLSIFLTSILEKSLNSARLRRSVEDHLEEEGLEESNSSARGRSSVLVQDLLQAAEQNPGILGTANTCFGLLEQIRIRAAAELPDRIDLDE